jgi:DNA-binding transcriptional regulator GbsR (MarR family)
MNIPQHKIINTSTYDMLHDFFEAKDTVIKEKFKCEKNKLKEKMAELLKEMKKLEEQADKLEEQYHKDIDKNNKECRFFMKADQMYKDGYNF